MNTIVLNVNNISYYEICKKGKSSRYYYVPFRNRLLASNIQAGFRSKYDIYDDNIYSKADIEESGLYIVDGNEVIYKDHINFYSRDGVKSTKPFENMEALNEFLTTNQLKSIKFIEI